MISAADVTAARHRIAGEVHHTPLLTSSSIGRPLGLDLFFKAELFQKTGSFKARGVLNRLKTLPDQPRGRGFIAFSAGNHGAALAWSATRIGARAMIVMPSSASRSKVEAIRAYGGEPVLTAEDLLDEARRLEAEHDLILVHPFDDPAVIAGQGTVGLEIAEDAGPIDAVVVPIGGGGLISGVARAIKSLQPRAQIIGVEPVGADAMARSLATGRPVRLDRTATIADGLAAPFAGALTFAHVRELVDRVVTVDDAAILDAVRLLAQRAKLVVEPAGAAALAALQVGAAHLERGMRVVCVLSGGNVSLELIGRL